MLFRSKVEEIAIASKLRTSVEEASDAIEELAAPAGGGRSLMAICCLSRSRPQLLDDSFDALRRALEEGNLSIAVFSPYPNQIFHETESHEITHLEGSYFDIRRSVDRANFNFVNTLNDVGKRNVALYVPQPSLVEKSATLIPPIVAQQFSLTVHKAANGVVTKTLQTWTPGTDTDVARKVKATGVFSVLEQTSLWESFFGGILRHWIEVAEEFLPGDHYWHRVRPVDEDQRPVTKT